MVQPQHFAEETAEMFEVHVIEVDNDMLLRSCKSLYFVQQKANYLPKTLHPMETCPTSIDRRYYDS